MADANKDERTLVMKQESGEDITYQVSEMSPEAQLIYSKIEILSKESQNTKVSAEFKLEQNQILQAHYLEALKPLIETSDEAETAEEVEDEQIADEESGES